jgi:hypothetical protein
VVVSDPFEPKKRALTPQLAAGLASESKIKQKFLNGGREALPSGRTFPAACCRVLFNSDIQNIRLYGTAVMKDTTERRERLRFNAKEGSVVEFQKPALFGWGRPRVTKSAAIVDISRGGLSFQYFDREMWSSKFNRLSISLPGDKIKIEEVSYEVVDDYTASKSFYNEPIRICCVKFSELTHNQQTQLDHFLQNCVKGECPERHEKPGRTNQAPSI